jgi:hypothetical protein
MSFDVFVQCYGDGEPPGLPIEQVRALFPIDERDSDLNFWLVRYEEKIVSNVFVKASGDRLTSMMIAGPPGNLRFWEALLMILRMDQVVIFWPGGRPMVALGNSAIVPREMVSVLGTPKEIETPEDFLELLELR